MEPLKPTQPNRSTAGHPPRSWAKKLALIVGAVFAFFFLALILPLVWMLVFPSRSAGLAAVSAGISEALVETFLFFLVAVIAWRVWVFAKRFRGRSAP